MRLFNSVKAFFVMRLAMLGMIVGSILMTLAYVLFMLVAMMLPARLFLVIINFMPWKQSREMWRGEEETVEKHTVQ